MSRRGPNQTQVNLLIDKDELAEFDRNVPRYCRSKVINALIRQFNEAKRNTTDMHVARRDVYPEGES